MIKTKNLQLIVCERGHLEAFARGKQALGELLQVTVPDSWPIFPEALELPAEETPITVWGGYFFIHPQDRILIGNGGFRGAPDEAGTVEIGYEIASEYWNRGFATEAAQGMIDFAFSHEAVQTVIAHTLAEKNASGSVLQKVGMTFIAEHHDPDEGKVWQWGISRNAYHPD